MYILKIYTLNQVDCFIFLSLGAQICDEALNSFVKYIVNIKIAPHLLLIFSGYKQFIGLGPI